MKNVINVISGLTRDPNHEKTPSRIYFGMLKQVQHDAMRRKKNLAILLILLLSALVYTSALGNKFVWDDQTFIFEWPLVRSFANIPKFFLEGALPAAHMGDYRPLKGLILTFDFHYFGVNPRWYVVQAIVIHLLAVCMVYMVSKKLTGNRIIGLTTAALFGVHPVHVEAVTFITSSTDVLGPVFALASFYFYIKRYDFKSRRLRNDLYSILFAALAFMSNEIVLILPLILILYDLLFRRNVWQNRKTYLPYFIMVAGVFAMRLFVIKGTQTTTYFADSFAKNMLLMPVVVMKYLKLLFLPLELSVNHMIRPGILSLRYVDFDPEAVANISLWAPDILGSAIGVFLLVGSLGILVFVKKSRLLAFCLGWFLITLVPTLNVIPIQILMSERYIYLTSFASSLLIAWALWTMWQRHASKDTLAKYIRIGSVIILILVLFYYSKLTWQRNLDWKDSLVLWGKTVAQVPESAIAHNNLGLAFDARGRNKEAISEFQLALQNDYLNSSKVRRNIGKVYLEMGEIDKAYEYLSQALTDDQENYVLLRYLGDVYYLGEEYIEAIEYYKKSQEINPYSPEIWTKLAIVYTKQKKYDKAVKYYEQAIALIPAYMQAYLDLADLYLKVDRMSQAVEILEKASKVDPENPQVRETLAKYKN